MSGGAVELAREWQFYATRFGILAEMHNGRYSEEQLKEFADQVIAIAEENAKMRAVVEFTAEEWSALAQLAAELRSDRRRPLASKTIDRLLSASTAALSPAKEP